MVFSTADLQFQQTQFPSSTLLVLILIVMKFANNFTFLLSLFSVQLSPDVFQQFPIFSLEIIVSYQPKHNTIFGTVIIFFFKFVQISNNI